MTGRIDFALRNLVGPWLSVPVLVLEVVNLQQRGAPWRGEPFWTAEWLAIALFVAGPLVAATVAVDTARLSRPGIIHLAIAPRGHRVHLHALAWCVVPVCVVHAATLVAAAVVGGSGIGGLLQVDSLLVLTTQLAAIVWYGCLGSLVGRVTTPLAAGLVGAISGLAAFYALSSGRGDQFELLALGGATVSRLGLAINPAYVLVQLVLLVATGAVMVLTGIRLRQGHRLPTRTAGVLLVAAAVVIVAAPSVAPSARVVAAPPAPPDLCFETDPTTVCFHEEHARIAPAIADQLNVLVDVAATNGYDALVPTRIDEADRVTTPSVWSFQAPVQALAGQEYDLPSDLLQDLLLPSQCAALSSDVNAPSDQYFDNLFSVIITWLSLLDDPQYDDVIEWEQEAGRRILTPAQVEAVVSGLQTCDLEVTV